MYATELPDPPDARFNRLRKHLTRLRTWAHYRPDRAPSPSGESERGGAPIFSHTAPGQLGQAMDGMEAPKWKSQNSFKINPVMEAIRDMSHE